MTIRDRIPSDKMELITRHVERIRSRTNIERFRSMYNKMKLTFGEENIQIKRIDEEYIIDTLLKSHGTVEFAFVLRSAGELQTSLDSLCSAYELLIRFPEVNVRNSKAESTIVRDIFVRLTAHPDGKLRHGMKGVTTTFTKSQYMRGYHHSHLREQRMMVDGPPYFGEFCLGTGEITQVLALLTREYNEVNFGMLCIHIKNFLEWESLEGVPYVTISSIPHVGQLPIVPSLPTSTVQVVAHRLLEIFRTTPQSQALPLVSLSTDGFEIEVKPTEELEKWAALKMEENPQHFGFQASHLADVGLIALKDPNGRYLACRIPNTGNISVPRGTVLKFRNEEIKVKIIDNETNLKSTKYANPKIIEQFCSKLSEELTNTAAEYAEAGSTDTSDDQREATAANTDAVQPATQS